MTPTDPYRTVKLKKINANGAVVATSICVVYVAATILLIRLFADKSGFENGLYAVTSGAIMGYYILVILTMFGGMIFVGLLYRFDTIMERPAPEWLFAALAVLVPGAIYYGIPPLPQ